MLLDTLVTVTISVMLVIAFLGLIKK